MSRTGLLLCLFLMSILCLVLGSLYLDARNKMALLNKEVSQLQQSQVLLMVPDDQAVVIADWLEKHPKQTNALIDMFATAPIKEGLQMEGEAVKLKPTPQQHEKNSVLVSETEDGVKVIKLPHGGIRVTTRDESHTKGNQ
jgi:hypothetical protein